MNALKAKLKISSKQQLLTAPLRKPKFYNAVKDNTLMKEDYNFMCDLLFLPTTSKGFKYAFVIVDLATDEFDIEPMKNKTPSDILNALKAIDKRRIIDIQENHGQSIRTDSGTEFQGVFHKYMFDNSILHRVGRPNRHIQLANVERLNGVLGALLNGYMTGKEEELGHEYKDWTDVIDVIRTDLNKIRKKTLPENIYTYHYPEWNGESEKNKFKVGDLVYVILESPEDRLGNKYKGSFRMGDYKLSREPKKIKNVFYYHGKPYYRYAVNGYDGVSFQEDELRKADEEEEVYRVKKIIGKRVKNRKNEYLVWWEGYKKDESTYEPEANLIKDGLQDMINEYKTNNKPKIKIKK